ncbi:hypothetical protein BH18ACT8_BH18ACT8_05850 [soil metagenome]
MTVARGEGVLPFRGQTVGMPDTPRWHRLEDPRSALDRRTVLRSAAVLGGAAFVVGCGGDSDTPAATGGTSAPSSSSSTGGGGGGGDVLGAVADVPVGGGAIFADAEVVVTQPTDGEFMAFSAVCTHAGCIVATVTDTINCDCHGSMYSIEDGSVVGGPAPEPLAPKTVEVDGSDIVLS